MLSLSSEYALRAVIHLAKHESDWPMSGQRIADEMDIPRKYLSKILSDLTRAGVLVSTRGKKGGFRLAKPSTKISLVDVLSPFEPIKQKRCPFGNQECSDENPCLAHDRWKTVLVARQRFLQATSIESVAFSQKEFKRSKKQRRPKRRA